MGIENSSFEKMYPQGFCTCMGSLKRAMFFLTRTWMQG